MEHLERDKKTLTSLAAKDCIRRQKTLHITTLIYH